MEVVKVEVELPKESYELAKGLGDFAADVKQALADGWQAGQDIPPILTSALTKLAPAVQGVEKIPDEAKGDPAGIGTALMVGLGPVFKKSAPAA